MLILPPERKLILPRGFRGPDKQRGFLLNPHRFGAAVNYSAWNAADKNASITLSDGDRRATSGATYCAVRGLYGKSSGKYYFEWQYNTLATGGRRASIGFANGSAVLNNYPGATSDSWALLGPGDVSSTAGVYNNNVAIGNNVAWNHSTSTRGGFALDLDNHKAWWHTSGTYFNSGDPAAGTNALVSGFSSTTYYPIWGGENLTSLTIYCNPADWTYSAPSGFSAWSQ